MKVLAQSTVASQPSYVHLGYLAATTVDIAKPWSGVAIGLVILGFLVATKFRVVHTERGRKILGNLRRPRVWVLVGVVLASGGAGILALGPRDERARGYAHPEGVTHFRMLVLGDQILGRQQVGEDVPDDIAELGKALPRNHDVTKDGWFRPMRLRKSEGDQIRYALVSAGVNGEFDSDDDITLDVGADAPATTPSERALETRDSPTPEVTGRACSVAGLDAVAVRSGPSLSASPERRRDSSAPGLDRAPVCGNASPFDKRGLLSRDSR